MKVCVQGKRLDALVDTGATASFVQLSVLKKLGLEGRMEEWDNSVRFGNGEVERMEGKIRLPLEVQGKHFPMEAYVLKGEGPGMILGFPFFEEHRLLVDFHERVLHHVGGGELACYPLHLDGQVNRQGSFKREEVDGNKPMWPTKKFAKDAGWDMYTPHPISILPGQRVTVDTGICCHFPEGMWGQLREKSGLAYRYGLIVLGGVIGEGYRGQIKVILHNTGEEKIMLPAKVAFCQMMLLPIGGQGMEGGAVLGRSGRGMDGGVNRELRHSGNGAPWGWGTGPAH